MTSNDLVDRWNNCKIIFFYIFWDHCVCTLQKLTKTPGTKQHKGQWFVSPLDWLRNHQFSSDCFGSFWKWKKKYSITVRVNMKICITKSSWCNKKRIDSSFFIKKNIIGQSTFRHIINFCWDCKKKFKLKKIHSFQNKFQHIYHHVSNE